MVPIPRAARRPSCLWHEARALARLGQHIPTTFASHTIHQPAETRPWDPQGRFVGMARSVELGARPKADRLVALARRGSSRPERPTACTPMTRFRAVLRAENIPPKSTSSALEEIYRFWDAWRLPVNGWRALLPRFERDDGHSAFLGIFRKSLAGRELS